MSTEPAKNLELVRGSNTAQTSAAEPSKPLKNSGTGDIKLKIIPVDDIEIIPWPLLEKLRGAGGYEPEDLIPMWNQFRGAPTSYLWAIVDPKHQVVGAVWSNYIILTRTIVVQFCVVDPSYQGLGHKVVKSLVVPSLRKLQQILGAKQIWFLTDRPAAWERMGFSRSGVVLMEV